jgi:coenzyme F420 hydrogenase subunit beta
MKTNGFDLLQREVLDADLCCGCGTCVGVCPAGALTIDLHKSYHPICDSTICTHCGLCYEVCPGRGYPVVAWSERRGDSDEQRTMDPRRGPVKRFLYGHSTDAEIRVGSASGGVATGLMLHMLQEGRVDEVAVVHMVDDRPAVKLTSDPADVRAALQSKYGPVPAMQIIAELRRRPRRIAMAFTPCQLGGWMRAAERMPKLRECLVLSIGLFCGQVQTYDSLEAIARAAGCKDTTGLKFLGWRCGAYPGSASFELPNGEVVSKPLYESYDVAIPHFSLNRCFLCPNGGNWMADMALGDIHAGGTDETVVVVRTERGHQMLEEARAAGHIELFEMDDRLINSTVATGISWSKLMPARYRNAWNATHGRPAPEFDYPPLPKRMLGRMHVLRYRLTMWLRKGWRRRWLLAHPRAMERVGHWMYYFPFSVPGIRPMIKLAARLARLARRVRGGGAVRPADETFEVTDEQP